jgi:hypothetical protein
MFASRYTYVTGFCMMNHACAQFDLFDALGRNSQLGKILQGIVHIPLSRLSLGLHIARWVHLYASALTKVAFYLTR